MIFSIIVKLILGIVAILFFMRISGKGQMGQVTPLDAVNTFVLGAFIGAMIYNPSLSAWYMLFAILIWTILNQVIRVLVRTTFFNDIINGKSDYLIKDGKVNVSNMKRNHLNIYQLKTILRENDVFSLLDANDVIFEPNGHFTIIKKRKNISYILVNNGSISQDGLQFAKMSEEDLLIKLSNLGFPDLDELFCVEWTEERGFYIIKNDGKVYY